MSIYGSSPQARVHFFPQTPTTGQRTILDTRQQDGLISVNTHKDLKQPAGSFSVTMTPRVPYPGQAQTFWRDILQQGDMVIIEMGPDRPQPTTWYSQYFPQNYGLEIVMIGSIDEIREQVTIGGDGRPSSTVTVRGRDFGKYLVDDAIWFDSWGQPMTATIKLTDFLDRWMKSHRVGTPAAVMFAVLDYMFRVPGTAAKDDPGGHDITFDLGQTGTNGIFLAGKQFLSHMLRVSLANDVGQIPFVQSILSYEGAPWNLMQQVSGQPFYQLVIDTRRSLDCELLMNNGGDGWLGKYGTKTFNTDLAPLFNTQPALLYYRTPFSNRFYDDWAKLPTRIVREDDVVSTDLGFGLDEITNTWRVVPEAAGFFKGPAKGPASDLETRDQDSIRRFGDRPLIQTSPFFAADDNATYVDLMRKLSLVLQDHNILNRYFLNGHMEMKGMAAVRVGDRLWWQTAAGQAPAGPTVTGVPLSTPGIDFYVEGVSQDYQMFQGWKTTVDLTRGQLHRERGTTLPFTDAPPVDDLANLVRVWGGAK